MSKYTDNCHSIHKDQQRSKIENSTMTHFDLVGQFHEVFGHPQRKDLYFDCFTVDPKLIPFRISLINEELKEFTSALEKKDVVEMADALCDLAYVSYGAGHCLGINLNSQLESLGIDVSSSNQSYNVDEDVLIKNELIIHDCLKKINNVISDFVGSAESEDLPEMGDYLSKLLDNVYSLGHKLGFDMNKMFREVHRSNMTKVCNNIEDAKQSIDFYEKEGRYQKPTIRIKGEYYVIFDSETTKILKNHLWEQPNLKQFF